MAVLLTGLAAGVGAALGLGGNANLNNTVDDISADPAAGLPGLIVLGAILLIAYYCGGYVAGRMSRFSGLKQGFAVWLWAVIIASIAALLGLIFGSRFDLLAVTNSFPRLPLNEGQLSMWGIIAVLGAAAVALIGALLGGLAGMRFHRRVDKATYDGGGRA
jgi:hypothetical protein